ncbi:hypothetical protein TL16_g00367 [Triparma laevis f. inornata]|uniref:Uncharacterized protein n=1 Tax=Triparma laevis f. inornata TaxID=1714386 RepID=A0A9W7DNN1_9STRA|nr:hypothetical protein TL16_g00367 [Triparma laevis f. inornata]
MSAPSLSSMYGLALMRGVNGLTDVSNQKGGSASSVSSIAQSLNLPSWLVDLRHDISHNDLPTLPCLRVASLQFLEFLFERFWDVKTSQISAAVTGVNSLLSQYKSASKRNESTREICKSLATSPRSVVTSCSINFLVYDGDCSSNTPNTATSQYKRGALIPGNPSTILCDEKGFEYILKRYKQIIIELQLTEDDFPSLLVVEIVGLMVSIEESGEKDSSADRVAWFALKWLEYLSSREYASSFDSGLAVSSKGVNLREKAQSKWKLGEKQFMGEGIRSRSIGIPFNGILDGLEGRGGAGSRKIEQRFQGILGAGRRSFKRRRVGWEGGGEGGEVGGAEEGEDDREITLEEMEAMMCEQQQQQQQSSVDEKEAKSAVFESIGWEIISEEDYEEISVRTF